LVECVLKLHENAEGTGTGARYAWRDLVALVRQPTLRMLQAGEEGQTPLKGAFQAWEKHIRSSGALQSAYSWVPVYDPEACPVSEQDFRTLLGEVQHACLDAFSGLTTLAGLGEALENLCALLKRRGGDIWHTFLIDAECLLRLWQSVVPELTGSILAQETYDQSLLFMILRHLLDGERVSFEPEPLAGMQVLGMLETRLLHFKRLFVLDATEDKLPGVSPPDPLLPDPLRLALWGSPAPARVIMSPHTISSACCAEPARFACCTKQAPGPARWTAKVFAAATWNSCCGTRKNARASWFAPNP
jgi:Inactivated superfamily I helicase